MNEGLVKVTPDRERATSIHKMAKTTLEMIRTIDEHKFPSNLVEQYYHVVRELIAAVLLVDGYKTQGEGAHKKLIEYLAQNYRQFAGDEISLMNDLSNCEKQDCLRRIFRHRRLSRETQGADSCGDQKARCTGRRKIPVSTHENHALVNR